MPVPVPTLLVRVPVPLPPEANVRVDVPCLWALQKQCERKVLNFSNVNKNVYGQGFFQKSLKFSYCCYSCNAKVTLKFPQFMVSFKFIYQIWYSRVS